MSLIMDPETLIALRNTFDTQEGAVEQLQTTIQSALANTVWESPAATQFNEIWNEQFMPMLNNLRESLTQAATGVQNSHDKVVQANAQI